MTKNISILSTAPLEPRLLNSAKEHGLIADVVPFIQIVDVADESETQKLLHQLYKQTATVIFTSANAVRAVCENPAFGQPDWKIYCVKNATKAAVQEYFDESNICGTSNDAASLADIIINQRINEDIYFFCGDQRMETLPEKLTQAGITLNEIIVYKTIEQPHFIEKEYDGILFFSPSAVNSYFNLNIPDEHTVLFAIGNTTAAAIRENSNNTLIISDEQSKEAVLNTTSQYFDNQLIKK